MMKNVRLLLLSFCGWWLVSCGVNRDAQLQQAVTFAFGDWCSADVRRLLDEGAEVNTRDEKGYTPLLNAYGIGCGMFEDDPQHEEAVASLKQLLAHGADVHCRTPEGHHALDLALRHFNNEPVVAILREQGLTATRPEYELVWHAMHNHADEVRRLLAVGVSPNACSVDGLTALWATMPMLNLKEHSAESMDLLLAAGADVSVMSDGHSLLDRAMLFAGEEMEPRYLDILRRYGAVSVNPPDWVHE